MKVLEEIVKGDLLERDEKMKVIFEEIVKGNLPKRGKEEEFSIVEGEKYYSLYCLGDPSKDRIMKFNLSEANSEKAEERCKKIFEFFGYRLNEETKEWGNGVNR